MAYSFTGEYPTILDAKGRTAVPSKFREGLGESFYVTKGFDGGLDAYPDSEWQVFEAELRSLPAFSEKARKLRRTFASKTIRCEIDKQGRILIPAQLRQAANLEKELMFVGNFNKVEIWNRDIYNETCGDDDIQSVAEYFAEKDINF